jgi:hypothetical protein
MTDLRATGARIEPSRGMRGAAPMGMASTKKTATKKRGSQKKWVRGVMQTSNAMDLEEGVFKGTSKEIAASLKRSVMRSKRTKGTKFQSAMSMLNLHINRSGKNLSKQDRQRLERAKHELRVAFGRE